LLALACVAGALVGPATAEVAPGGLAQAPDTAAVDTLSVEPAAGDTLAAPAVVDTVLEEEGVQARETRKPRAPLARFDRPRWVMLRSAVVPGWGQLHNGSWIKAVGVAAGEISLVVRLFDDRRVLDRLEQQVLQAERDQNDDLREQAVTEYNTRLDAATSRQWLLGGVIAYALLDAYIDAHFRNFKAEFEVDPALPEGGAPAGGRLGVRMRF
jgi:hypothetical protein